MYYEINEKYLPQIRLVDTAILEPPAGDILLLDPDFIHQGLKA